MDIDLNALNIVNNEADHQFEVYVGDHLGYVLYRLHGGSISLTHTEVAPALEGKGVAGKLAQYALEYAKTNNLKVFPSCPYIKSYIQRHPEYQPLVVGGA